MCRQKYQNRCKRINKRIGTRSRSIASFLSFSTFWWLPNAVFCGCVSQFSVTYSQFLHRHASAGMRMARHFIAARYIFPVRWFHFILIFSTIRVTVSLFCAAFLSFVSQWEKFKLICIWRVCVWPWSLLTAPRSRSLIRSHNSLFLLFFALNCNLCNVYGFVNLMHNSFCLPETKQKNKWTVFRLAFWFFPFLTSFFFYYHAIIFDVLCILRDQKHGFHLCAFDCTAFRTFIV